MSPVPQIPSGGSRQQRAAQLKAETEAKQAQAQAAEAGGPRPGQQYTLQEGNTLESIARQVEQEPETIWNHENNAELRERRGTPEQLQAGDTLFIPGEEEETEPVGQGDYVVKEGDCISSIAKDTGHFWETIWNHGDNAELKEVRKDPNVLLPGDRVTIPEKTPKEESGETEQRHRFVRRGEPAALHLRLLHEGEPVANQEFVMRLNTGEERRGTTDTDGNLEVAIPGNAARATLTLGSEGQGGVYHLKLGHVLPPEKVRGLQQRLTNMGISCGPVDGVLGPLTRAGLRQFQESKGLEVNGQPDERTQEALKSEHGS